MIVLVTTAQIFTSPIVSFSEITLTSDDKANGTISKGKEYTTGFQKSIKPQVHAIYAGVVKLDVKLDIISSSCLISRRIMT